MEAGLWDDVSFNKGCYTGQEIIARMESRGKLAKQLARLTSSSGLQAGQTIHAGGKRVGEVTSAASTENGAVALGYIKSAALANGDQLMVAEQPVAVSAGSEALEARR